MRARYETRLIEHVGGPRDGTLSVWEACETERKVDDPKSAYWARLSWYDDKPRRAMDGVYRETAPGIATWFPRITDEAWAETMASYEHELDKARARLVAEAARAAPPSSNRTISRDAPCVERLWVWWKESRERNWFLAACGLILLNAIRAGFFGR